MEDWNMLCADCVVISCCCQCLILQVLVFVLLKLPCSLFRRTREHAKKKLGQRKRDERGMQREMGAYYEEELVGIHDEQSVRIQAEMALADAGHRCGCCMEEVEKVMEELYQRGEFAFGSFWGRKGIVTKDQNDDSFVRYQIIDLVGS